MFVSQSEYALVAWVGSMDSAPRETPGALEAVVVLLVATRLFRQVAHQLGLIVRPLRRFLVVLRTRVAVVGVADVEVAVDIRVESSLADTLDIVRVVAHVGDRHALGIVNKLLEEGTAGRLC